MDFEMTLKIEDENHDMDFNVTETLKGKDGESYDDTELKNRVTELENTIGTLNDSLEVVLNGE